MTAKKATRKATRRTATPKTAGKTTAPRGAGPRAGAAAKRPPKTSAKPIAPRAGLKVGDVAPEFALLDQSGKTTTLSDFRGRSVLLYFYPRADTPGCTVQSCSVRDARKALARKAVDVLGISPDLPGAQSKFDVKFGLGFPLLSDPDRRIAAKYGAWGEKTMYGRKVMGIIRSSFLIGPDGTILGAWNGVRPDETVPKAKAALGLK